MNFARSFITTLLIGVLSQCTNIVSLGGEGNGSETTARGIVVDSSGAPVSGIQVQLLSTSYNPVVFGKLSARWRTITNGKGEYRLDNIAEGTYSLEAGSDTDGAMASIKNIKITGKKVDTVMNTGRLQKPGTILVQLAGLSSRNGDYVYLPGTSRFTVISDHDKVTGNSIISNVPAGKYTDLIYVTSADSHSVNLLTDTLTMHPGDTVESAYTAWKYSRQLTLNTSVTGAGITNTVTDFPVIIRLNTATFNFSQAQSKGEDIRFSKANGSPLPYQIESWDAAGYQAVVWVKIDTVRGNDSTQAITMYWGNPDIISNSNSVAVFDTAAKFQGVWHLGENSENITDATINKFNGIRKGNQSRGLGEINYGQSFTDSGDYTELGDVGNPGTSSFTISAWVKPSISGDYRTIISKSNGGLPSATYGWNVSLDPTGKLVIFMATDTATQWGKKGSFVLASKADCIVDTISWHHVAVVIDRSNNTNCRVYIDGVDVSYLPTGGDIATVGHLVNTYPLRIGNENDGDGQWTGSIDECTISYTVRPAAWVQLCFINQGQNDRLVQFK
jgi:hypothetical protein